MTVDKDKFLTKVDRLIDIQSRLIDEVVELQVVNQRLRNLLREARKVWLKDTITVGDHYGTCEVPNEPGVISIGKRIDEELAKPITESWFSGPPPTGSKVEVLPHGDTL